nr:hypothetical protein [Tanacetum cinerariifolium]
TPPDTYSVQAPFWGVTELWIGDEPLCSHFNRLYRLDINENCTIRDRFVEGNWSWQWKRPVTLGQTEHMLSSLLSVSTYFAFFSPRYMEMEHWFGWVVCGGTTRAFIDQLLLPSLNTATRWNTCLPRKVNIFIWRLHLDRLPHRLNLSKRGLEIDSILCPICNNNVESIDHVFFSCEVASSAWRLLRIWCNIFDLSIPSYTNWISWIDNMPGSNVKKDRLFVIVTSMFWILWKYQNNVTFNSHVMRKYDIFDSILLFSFNWLKYRGRKVFNWTDSLCNPL